MKVVIEAMRWLRPDRSRGTWLAVFGPWKWPPWIFSFQLSERWRQKLWLRLRHNLLSEWPPTPEVIRLSSDVSGGENNLKVMIYKFCSWISPFTTWRSTVRLPLGCGGEGNSWKITTLQFWAIYGPTYWSKPWFFYLLPLILYIDLKHSSHPIYCAQSG